MKNILILLFLFPVICAAQDKKGCPVGYAYVEEMATTSLIIQGGCVTKKQANALYKMFEKSLCEETGFAAMTDIYLEEENHTWSDKKGCIIKFIYQKKINNVWVNISKKEYTKHAIFMTEK